MKKPVCKNRVLGAVVVFAWLLRPYECPAQLPIPPGADSILTVAGASVHPTYSLLKRPDVQRELNLLDDQVAKLQEVRRQLEADLTKAVMAGTFADRKVAGNKAAANQAAAAEIRDAVIQVQKKGDAELGEILLPQQLKRLKQLDYQSRLATNSLDFYGSGELARELNLTPDEQRKMERRIAEIKQEYIEKIEKAKQEAVDDARQLLTPQQRAQLNELMGPPFRFDDAAGARK